MYYVCNLISASKQATEFLDLVAGIQGSRMNDQRADLPEFPGLHNQDEVTGQYVTNRREDNALDDQFSEMLIRCQVGSERSSYNSIIGFLAVFTTGCPGC